MVNGKNKLTSAEKRQLRLEVKRANQRLATQYKKGIRTSSYKYIERAEKRGSKIYSKASSGSVKFRTDIASMTNRQITELKKALQKYLYEAKTTTKIGTEKVYKERYKKFKETTKADIDFQTYLDMWELASQRNLETTYTSGDLAELFAKKPNDFTNEEMSDFLLDNEDKPLILMVDKKEYDNLIDKFRKKEKTKKKYKDLF